ncbi:hypothetical protein GCM10023149_27400 [Mucilaginibacter gynuensis]|uniref:Lipoprotein n=1 Tax=Mucilaginibacter gynuensis TaxID=1302236 RepID=A0ABP8GJ74_9SPHI
MKKPVTLLLLLATLAITACKKEKRACCVLPPGAEFYLAGKQGDSTWFGKPTAVFYNDSLNVYAGHGEQHMNIRIKFTGKGKYSLNNTNAIYYVTVGQDVIVANYWADNTADNWITVTNYDKANNIITGDFNLSFVPVRTPIQAMYSFYINISKGKFRVALPK